MTQYSEVQILLRVQLKLHTYLHIHITKKLL